MPPKKKSAAIARPPLPVPNATHPCASLIPSVLDPASLIERPHPASYHAFLTSPYYPIASPSSEPPTKKRKKDSSEPKLPPALDSAIEAAVVQKKLLAWFDGVKEKRGMPWRKEVDPKTLSQKDRTQRGYEVWVSEIMLQQTQVATVIPYWKKWMEKFPTVKALAKADIEEVNEVWKGLGYYSRAKRLLDGAKTVMEKHDGILPETAEGLLDIDGIGPYSAGSISSIAFAQRSPMVDGNVTRVLSRLTAFHAPAAAKATTSYIWALADVLVPPQPKKKKASSDGDDRSTLDVGGLNKPGAWNQALMELGATVCTPKNPNCAECPLNDECLAYAEARYVAHRPAADGSAAAAPDIEDLCTLCAPLPYEEASEARRHGVEVYPMAKEKTKKRDEETAVCVLEWVPSGTDEKSDEGRKVLLIKRPEKGLLAGLYEFPAVDLPASTAPSTPKARSKYLDKLLHTLLDISSSTTFSPSSPEDADSSDLRIMSRSTLPPVTHVYSHMNRTYHSERLVISSPSFPSLRKASPASPAKKDDLVQSLPCRGKWVDAADVEGENVGGAVGKVWEERQLQAKGLASKNGAKAKGKAKAGEGAKTAKVEKRQGSLAGFFVKKEEKRVKETVEVDDELIVVEEKHEVKVGTNGGKAEAVVEQQSKIYKKRRIAPASDDEDE
ncbi:Adenine DNA glycosylase [Rhodotorula toruloides]|nr:Adenine DNA glycosylase [Rhodotorula toruloides]